MAQFNYGTPYGIYGDVADYLNSLSRGIPPFVVAQNLGKLSPFMRRLLSTATVKDLSYPFVSQPVATQTVNNLEYVDQAMTFTVPTTLDTNLTNMATFYSNLGIIKLLVSLMEVHAYQNNEYELFNLMATRASSTWLGGMDALTQNILGSRVSGSPPTEDTKKFYGIKDVVDNGTTNPNYGNIARGTNTWWNSYIWDAQATWTDTPPAYVYVMRALSKYQNLASTMGLPRMAFTSAGVYQKLIESFTNIERYVVADTTTLSQTREYEVTGIMINGVAIFPDPYITDTTVYFINWDHLEFKFASGFAVTASDWRPLDILGKLQFMSYLLIGGQLICDAPVAHFALTNMPTVANV